MLVLWLFMVSRMDYQSQSRPEGSVLMYQGSGQVTQERRDSVRAMMGKAETASTVEERSSRLFMNAFTTFVVMMVLLGGVWYWSRRKSGIGSAPDILKEVGRHSLAPGQFIKILEVNDEIWVVGVASGSVTLLHRYSKSEWKAPVTDRSTGKQRFYDMFSGKS
jgi:flagellar biogenesis protein FliO